MSEFLETIILGIVQGVTEFLPVSSSGHLELAKYILGDESLGEESLLMTVVLHFATALSTLIVFRKEVITILKGLFKPQLNEDRKFALNIVLSMIPAVIIGLAFEEQIEELFTQKIGMVGLFLIVTGILLLFADKAKNTIKKVGVKEAIIIGLAQAIAIIPGISRSGATISTSVLLKIDRTEAARFSFLMVVPLIFGKIAKDLLSGDLSASNVDLAPMIIGFFASFITGIIACKLMIHLVQKSQLKYFSYYCFVVGALAILFSIIYL
jgi:undecaprenyl-diphosphatase